MSAARWVRRAGAVACALVVGVVAAASGAAAAARPTFLCSELPRNGVYVVDLRVRGDVVADAPDGVPCLFVNVVVEGDVLVRHDGRVLLDVSTVLGSVRSEGPVSIVHGSVVEGDVVLDDAHTWTGLDVRDSRVDGSVTGRTGYARLFRSTVAGSYDVDTVSRAQLARTTVGGPVLTRGGRLLVHDTTVGGGLSSSGSGEVLVCRTVVTGDLTVTDVRGYVRLGVEADERCRTTVGGDVVLVDNPHSLDLGDLAVAGDLVCTGNTGPRGITFTPLTTVAGARTGQCA